MIDTGLLVVVTITFTILLCVLILLCHDFEQWCPQVFTSFGWWMVFEGAADVKIAESLQYHGIP